MTKVLRGFGWTVHKAGDPEYQTQNDSGWAEKGTRPSQWQAIKDDPTIDQARLYTSAQRHVRADRRRILDSKEQSS